MTNIYLSSGVNFILNNSDVTVFGTGGANNEVITVGTGVIGLRVDQNVERIAFSGASSAFTYQQQGISLVAYSGTSVVATIPLQADANGTQLTFTNGTVNVTVGASGMRFGGAAVPAGLTSAQAAAVTPTTIDSTVASTTSSTTPTAPSTGSSIDNGSTLSTLNAANGSINYTDDASLATNVVITSFTNNDRISVTGATVNQYSFATGDAGRDLVMTFNNTTTGAINSIVLDDVLIGNSAFIFDFATARSALGFDFMVFG